MPTIISITNQCNQNCLFCSANGRKDDTSFKNIRQLIDHEKDLIVISGGEPTLSKELFRTLQHIKSRNLRIELQTNGVTLSYFDLAKKLIAGEIDLFNINFPSHLEDLTDKITQTKGLFKKRMEGIKNLQKLKANIRLTHVVNSLNYRQLEDYVIFISFHLKEVNYIQFSFIKIIGQAKRYPEILITYEMVEPYLLKAFNRCQKLNICFTVDHIPPCYLNNFRENHVDYQKMKRGEILDYSLQEKVKLEDCSSCIWSSYCYGVRKDYLKFFGPKTKVKPDEY